MKFCGIFSVLLISCVIVASDDSNTTTVSTMVPSTMQSSPTASPTSATTPAPATRPDGGRWNVTDESTNIVCILFDGGIRIETMPQTVVVDIPANATASGSCNLLKQDIMFTFMANSMNWNLSFIFSKAVNESKYNLTDFILVNDAGGAAKINDKGTVNEGVLNSEDISRSYVCSKMQTVYGPKNITSGLKAIKIVGVKFEAFRNTTTDIFGLADKCTADDVSQLVPIIVGAALAGLIIIVLIAYLIGRKRSKRGYESV